MEKRVYQELLQHVQKPLLKRFQDPVEKCRQIAIEILKQFFSNCDDLTISFPYVFPVLVDWLNAINIEGYEHIEDEMKKPTPSQHLLVMVKPPEPSEELWLLIAEMLTIIIEVKNN